MKKVLYYLIKNQVSDLLLDCAREIESIQFWFSYNHLLIPAIVHEVYSLGESSPKRSILSLSTEVELENFGEEAVKQLSPLTVGNYKINADGAPQKTYLVTKIMEQNYVYVLYFKAEVLYITTTNRVPYYDRQIGLANKDASIFIKMFIPASINQTFRIEKGEDNVFSIYND